VNEIYDDWGIFRRIPKGSGPPSRLKFVWEKIRTPPKIENIREKNPHIPQEIDLPTFSR